jgi:PEP-CTERM motif
MGETLMNRLLYLVASLAVLAASQPAAAVVLEDFQFNDPNNTGLAAAANSANPGNQWVEDTDHAPTIQVKNGSLNIVKNDTNFVTEGLGLDDVSSGTLYMVAEFKNWAILGSAPDGNNVEEIRFGFNATEDLIPPPSSTVLAEMWLRRNFAADTFEILGTALGSGTDISSASINYVQNDPFTMVMKVDQDTNKYRILYKDGANPYVTLGVGDLDPARDALIVRFTINNFIGDEPGEFANLDRFYISNNNPIPEPATLALAAISLMGMISMRRRI